MYVVRTNGDNLAVTQAGSRPGESWADAIFCYVYSRVLGTLTERADGESLLSYLPGDIADGVFDNDGLGQAAIARDGTWADDTALPLEDADPVRLVQKDKRLTAITLTTFEEFGLSPNLKRDKTTIVMQLAGREYRRPASWRTRMARPSSTSRTCVSQCLWLRSTPIWGLCWMLVLRCRLNRRLALLGAAYDQGKKLLFQNRTIPL